MKIDWNKLLSGRFIFTVFAAFVFVNAAIDKTLSPSQTEAILMLIIGFYFNLFWTIINE